MNDELIVLDIIGNDRWRMGALSLLAELDLPDGWVVGGFVRNAIWDALHHRPMTPLSSVDVMYCDPERPEAAVDEDILLELNARAPKKKWTVRNVAREGVDSVQAALRRQPETASAVGVRLASGKTLEVLAPLGLADLLDLVVRPTSGSRAEEVRQRSEEGRWTKIWPRLKSLEAR